MWAQFSDTYKGAYVVRTSDLNKLRYLLESRIGEVKIAAECVDGASRQFNTWNDFDSYENAPSSEIVELLINSRSSDHEKSVRLNISREHYSTMRLIIDCPDDEFLKLKVDITDILDGMKHKVLSIFFDLNIFPFFMTFWAVFSLIFTIWSLNVTDTGTNQPIDWRIVLSVITICICVAVLYGMGYYGALKLRPKILPTVYFAIGQGQQRYENWKSRWQWVLGFSALALGIIGISPFVI